VLQQPVALPPPPPASSLDQAARLSERIQSALDESAVGLSTLSDRPAPEIPATNSALSLEAHHVPKAAATASTRPLLLLLLPQQHAAPIPEGAPQTGMVEAIRAPAADESGVRAGYRATAAVTCSPRKESEVSRAEVAVGCCECGSSGDAASLARGEHCT